MFPKEVPNKLILKYSKPGDIVYDPFSGRGTTLLEAKLENRFALGNDLNPLAYVISKSRVDKIDIEKLFNRISKLENQYNNENNKINFNYDEKERITVFYSEKNLKQLFFIKQKIGINFSKNNEYDNYILAILLGIMQGQAKKNGDSIYVSVSMPNTYSMAPNYANNYIKKHQLKKPESNVFDLIRNRINSNLSKDLIDEGEQGIVKFSDTLSSEIAEYINKNQLNPNLIITSPPYLNIVKYADQNWIRLWLLGFDNKNDIQEIKLDDKHSIDQYGIFIIDFLKQMNLILKDSGKLIVIIGDVKNRINIKNFMDSIITESDFKYFKNPHYEHISQSKKSSKSMGKRVGKATKKDWFFFLERI